MTTQENIDVKNSKPASPNKLLPGELATSTMKKDAPAIYGKESHGRCGDKYQVFRTNDIINALRKNEWHPVQVSQTRSKDAERDQTNKHLVRFRQAKNLLAETQPEDVPEIILLNAHNRYVSAQLHVGVFRFACANGLIVGDQFFQPLKFRHTPNMLEEMRAATDVIASQTGALGERIAAMKAVKMLKAQQLEFASNAIDALNMPSSVTPEAIIVPQRDEDKARTLWNTYNVVQEWAVKGGVEGVTSTGRQSKTRGVNNMHSIVRHNASLWNLADEIAQAA